MDTVGLRVGVAPDSFPVSLGLNKEKPKETTLDVYKANFEDDFLMATEVYYTAESTHFIGVNTVADYMKKVQYHTFLPNMTRWKPDSVRSWHEFAITSTQAQRPRYNCNVFL